MPRYYQACSSLARRIMDTHVRDEGQGEHMACAVKVISSSAQSDVKNSDADGSALPLVRSLTSEASLISGWPHQFPRGSAERTWTRVCTTMIPTRQDFPAHGSGREAHFERIEIRSVLVPRTRVRWSIGGQGARNNGGRFTVPRLHAATAVDDSRPPVVPPRCETAPSGTVASGA